MIKLIGKYLLYSCGVAFIIISLFQLWIFGKKLNYTFSYKSMVEKTIQEMVKPEALK